MNIEEIKATMENIETGIFDHTTGTKELFLPMFEYLISIIEKATTFFEMVEVGQYPGELHALRLAEEYLQAIRGK